jgi:hypothetical protein
MRRIDFISEHDFTRVEFDWLAHDRAGQIGLMTTAGAGPVPVLSLENSALLDNILDQILLLPVVCEAEERLVGAHNMQDWLDVARRGIYGFDWRRDTNSYRLIARPLEPLTIDRLGQPLRALAARVSLPMNFAKDAEFDAAVGAWKA